jgi:ABC-type uncharacterized transport system permease subunit
MRDALSPARIRWLFDVVRAPVIAIGLAFLFASLLVLLTGKNPIDAAEALWVGAFASPNAFAGTLALATPLLFTALAFAVPFRGSMFNAGAEGQLLVGAFCSAYVGFTVVLPGPLHAAAMVVAGAVGGAVWAFLPALWRVTLGANEIVTTLMMNFIAVFLTDFLVLHPFRAPGQSGSAIKTEPIAGSAELLKIWPPFNVTIALPIAILLIFLIWYAFRRTVVGYEVRMVGAAPRFAEAEGIRPGRRMLAVMAVGGALAGIGGAVQVGGVFHSFVSPFGTGLGFNGILVALLVSNSFLAIPFGAVFIGALQSGAIGMELTTSISRYIVASLTATIIIFVAARRVGWSGLRFRSPSTRPVDAGET